MKINTEEIGETKVGKLHRLATQPFFFFFFSPLSFLSSSLDSELQSPLPSLLGSLGVKIGTGSDRSNREEVKGLPGALCLARGTGKDVGVAKKIIVGNIQRKLTADKKLKLKGIEFRTGNSSNTSVEFVIEVKVVIIFRGKKETGEEKAVDSHGVNKPHLLGGHSLEINKSNNEAFNSTRGIGSNSLNVLAERDDRGTKGMKFGFSSGCRTHAKRNKITQLSGKGVDKLIQSGKGEGLELHSSHTGAEGKDALFWKKEMKKKKKEKEQVGEKGKTQRMEVFGSTKRFRQHFLCP